MDLEQLATSAVETSISKVDKLKAFVGANEKGPSFDGYIGIFSNKNFLKKNFKRVNVQIKGKRVKKLPNNKTYQISVVDLNNYKNLGGSIFFVVYINENGEMLEICYVSLLPFSINEILKGKENNKTVSVSLKSFPTDNNAKYELLINFFADAQKQSSYVNIEPLNLEELLKSGSLESLSFSYTPINSEEISSEFPFYIEGKELFIYAKTKGNPLPIPIQHINQVEKIQGTETIEKPIYVGTQKYYDSYEVIHLKETVITKIGNSFTLTTDKKHETLNYRVKIKGTLRQQINDIRFVLEFFKHNEFRFGNCTFPLNTDEVENKDKYLDSLKNQLDYLEEILETLTRLNVKKDLDIENLSEEDSNRLEVLKNAILYDKATKAFNGEPPIVAKFKISNIVLLLFFIKENDGIKIHDFFQMHCNVIAKDKKGNEYEVSQFDDLGKDLILECDNVDCASVVDDFKSKPLSNILIEYANDVMLQMLLAYDECKNGDLLSAASNMSDWICENSEYLSDYISRINQLQIYARMRKLSIEEKSELIKIYNNCDSEETKIGCLLLIDEIETAMKLFNELPIERQDLFKSYPIWYFAKQNNS